MKASLPLPFHTPLHFLPHLLILPCTSTLSYFRALQENISWHELHSHSWSNSHAPSPLKLNKNVTNTSTYFASTLFEKMNYTSIGSKDNF